MITLLKQFTCRKCRGLFVVTGDGPEPYLVKFEVKVSVQCPRSECLAPQDIGWAEGLSYMVSRVPRTPLGDLKIDNYMEQYKAYLADLGNIGTRYATVQGFYISVISGLLGILALTESSKEGQKVFSALPTPTLIIVCVFCCVLCGVWSLTISFYQKLFHAKIYVLKEVENYLPVNCFELEYEKLTETKTGHSTPSLLRIEKYVPIVLVAFFALLAGVRLYNVATAFWR
jgi:hypothetical protein